MIADADLQLTEWVSSVAPGAEVSLDPPTTADGGRVGDDRVRISLYLLRIAPAPAKPHREGVALNFCLDYLVTCAAPAALEAHRCLGALLAACAERSDFELDLEPLPARVWTALGAVPQPSFILRVSATHQRPGRASPPVTTPIKLRISQRGVLLGTLLGPEDRPVVGARVGLGPGAGGVRTDDRGRFRLSVPGLEPRGSRAGHTLWITARGRTRTERLDPDEFYGDRPVTIRLESLGE